MVQELRKRRDNEIQKNKYNDEKQSENIANSENVEDETIKPYVTLLL